MTFPLFSCPYCANNLTISASSGGNKWSCRTCPYEYGIHANVSSQLHLEPRVSIDHDRAWQDCLILATSAPPEVDYPANLAPVPTFATRSRRPPARLDSPLLRLAALSTPTVHRAHPPEPQASRRRPRRRRVLVKRRLSRRQAPPPPPLVHTLLLLTPGTLVRAQWTARRSAARTARSSCSSRSAVPTSR